MNSLIILMMETQQTLDLPSLRTSVWEGYCGFFVFFFLTDCHPLEGTKQASGRVLFSEATKA